MMLDVTEFGLKYNVKMVHRAYNHFLDATSIVESRKQNKTQLSPLDLFFKFFDPAFFCDGDENWRQYFEELDDELVLKFVDDDDQEDYQNFIHALKQRLLELNYLTEYQVKHYQSFD